jgi:AcrR family transcriptional regulator
MSSTPRGDRARTEIVSAAQSLLAEKGADGFRLREVARRAGYAPAALYNHFSGIDELIVATAMQGVGTLAAYLDEVPEGSAVARLKGLGHAYVRFAQENEEAYAVVFDRLANPPHTWDEYISVAHPFSVIVATCEDGLATGELADLAGVGSGGIAYALWCLVHGHVRLRARHLSRIDGDFDRMLDAGIDALLAGFAR